MIFINNTITKLPKFLGPQRWLKLPMCLLHKHRDPSLNTSVHAKDHAALHICTLIAGDTETGGYWGLDASQSSQIGKLRVQWEILFQKIRWRMRGRFVHLWPPLHVYVHPQIKAQFEIQLKSRGHCEQPTKYNITHSNWMDFPAQ